MPTYEFRCPKGHDFEKFYRSISGAPAEVHCPECGALAVRQMSGAGLVFKGSGFYITDYGKDGKKDHPKPAVKSEGGAGEKSDSGAKPAESGGDGGTSESKPSESKPSDSKSSESKASDSKSSDSAGGDSKAHGGSDAKQQSSDSKSSGSGTESKPAPAPVKKKEPK